MTNLLSNLKTKWEQCEKDNISIFRYKLDVTEEKVLQGELKFLIQVSSIVE